MALNHGLQRGHALVQNHWMVRERTHHPARLVRLARLFDIERKVVDSGHHTHRFVLHPATVGVSGEFVARFEHRRDLLNAFDISICARANLHLKLVEALLLIIQQLLLPLEISLFLSSLAMYLSLITSIYHCYLI